MRAVYYEQFGEAPRIENVADPTPVRRVEKWILVGRSTPGRFSDQAPNFGSGASRKRCSSKDIPPQRCATIETGAG